MTVLSPLSQSSPSLADWLYYIEQKHPQHQIELGLARIRQVAEQAGLHQLPGKKILLAGTNGKGTTARTLEQLLLAQGFSVGVYSSPHLVRFNERLRLNDQDVADPIWVEAFAAIERLRGDIELTYFEFTTLAAFFILCQQQPDFCLIEVGLGGRLDATNIIEPDLSLLTTIDLDHQEFLGPDRTSIGREKAGIFRPAVPAVVLETDVPQSVLDVAQALQTPLWRSGEQYRFSSGQLWDWQSDRHQLLQLPKPAVPQANAAAALMALELLDALPDAGVVERVLLRLSLPGRMQWLSKTPAILLDVAHNPQSAAYLAGQLAELQGQYHTVHALVGMLKDKDIHQSLQCFAGKIDQWHLVSLPGVRGASAEQLAAVFSDDSVLHCYSDLAAGFHSALSTLQQDDLLVIFGSFVTVSAVLALQMETEV
ncbi:bifunctional tetrahydrofolate synthase/dihydrofolate synthase [Rheinheimera sp.]|uniref:bifunctional tetrahydrofolate synthase/dihydrofolate synthase n=1 Tax=Rheinheimera sp. TaxID=1869214 RepID=UPI00307DA63F